MKGGYMKNQKFKEKINKICKWTLVFMGVYLIVGAFLLRLGTNFDPNKAYDLIKDALTISASFLAPVAAIVLFNDWREEHRVKSLSLSLDLINSKAIEIEELVFDCLEFILKDEKIDHIEIIFTKPLNQLSLLYREIRTEKNIEKFLYLVSSLHTEIRYFNRLSIEMNENLEIVKKFEELNKTKDIDDQIYPIPHKDKYESNRQELILLAPKIENLINNMIDQTKIIKDEL